jgi:replicative DNA helicase
MDEIFTPINVVSKEEFHERIEEEIIPYGIPFLDTVLDGILPTDLVLIGAATGRGKSELAVDIALKACQRLEPVHMFALEAEKYEVHRRLKYKIIAQKYYEDGGKESINYQAWRANKLPDLLRYEEFANKKLALECQTLNVFYRDTEFDIFKFEKIFSSLEGKSSLVILDHLGYVDVHTENENKAYGDIMKKIKDLSQLHKIPVVAVAHLRKQGQARTNASTHSR